MAAAQEKASERVVVLLRPGQKRKLQKLARNERVSVAEIVRRSLMFYSAEENPEEKRLLAELNVALDRNLARIRSTNASIESKLDKIQRRRSKAA
ncbi:MAG TPA: hypothetical protein VIJ65_08400 [Acidobacteriaceae bacterium]